ncbi:hypothetical protein PTE_02564 [Photorhabdus khanii NC19]|uniref:Uncharacterized protein n=1 Tax=Photorhabdus khanii NC19 TaxID=1004151 RepID=W3V6G4_9GAMM|nr:hypothetical protein PTE_02564 [Photorhabdus khanii NC19]
MIAQALRFYQTIVDRHISDYFNQDKLKPDNGGLIVYFLQSKLIF